MSLKEKKKSLRLPMVNSDPFPKDISLMVGLGHHGSLGCPQCPLFSSLLCLLQEEAAAKLPDLDGQAEAQASLQCWLALPLRGYCVNDVGTPKSHRLFPQHDTPHARGAAINDQLLWVL